MLASLAATAATCHHHQKPAMDGSWMGSSPQASIDHPAPAGPASLRGTGGVSGGIYSGSLPALRRVVVGLACRCSSPSRTTCGAAAAGAAAGLSLFQHNQCAVLPPSLPRRAFTRAHLPPMPAVPGHQRPAYLRRPTVRAPPSPCTLPTPCAPIRLLSIGAQCTLRPVVISVLATTSNY